jgi:hypothetical protein
VTCAIPALAANQAARIGITGVLAQSAANIPINAATVNSPTADPDTANNGPVSANVSGVVFVLPGGATGPTGPTGAWPPQVQVTLSDHKKVTFSVTGVQEHDPAAVVRPGSRRDFRSLLPDRLRSPTRGSGAVSGMNVCVAGLVDGMCLNAGSAYTDLDRRLRAASERTTIRE